MSQDLQRRFNLREFKAISRAISTYEDLNILVQHFVEGICLAFKIKGAAIMLYDEVERQLFRVASYGMSEAYLNKGPVFLWDKDDAFVKGEPVFVQDLQNDSRVQYPESARIENIRAMLSFPIKCREAVVGLLRIYHSEPIVLHPEDVESITVLSLHLGMVIEMNGLGNCVHMVCGAISSLPPRMRQGL
ncbi:MAG: GAF domain-containing protein [Desulfatitalea sp.]|nr:GAF domain-containing protein [Desulfatitalea sp.]NNK02417.1 GAF domain-containing protein [Desulfatitalea sp.]